MIDACEKRRRYEVFDELSLDEVSYIGFKDFDSSKLKDQTERSGNVGLSNTSLLNFCECILTMYSGGQKCMRLFPVSC